MTASPKALVEAPVIKWMRTSSGYSLDDLAHKLGTSHNTVRAWEDGEELPSMAQVRKLAGVYKRPISDLFLMQPPQPTPLPHDFRRTTSFIGEQYSPQLRHELRASVRRRQNRRTSARAASPAAASAATRQPAVAAMPVMNTGASAQPRLPERP